MCEVTVDEPIFYKICGCSSSFVLFMFKYLRVHALLLFWRIVARGLQHPVSF